MLPPLNGQLIYSQGGLLGPFPTGTSVQLNCNMGTVPQGQSSAFCQQGIWQPSSLGQCISNGNNMGLGNNLNSFQNVGFNGIGCPSPLPPLNGQIQYSGVMNMGTYPSGTTSNLICNAGMFFFLLYD